MDPKSRISKKLQTKAEVEAAIFTEVHNDHICQAESTPVCEGLLFDDFGYSATTISADNY